MYLNIKLRKDSKRLCKENFCNQHFLINKYLMSAETASDITFKAI